MPLSNLASGIADNVGLDGSIFSRGDVIRKRFISVQQNPKSSGNGLTDYDDPTYLGFQLTFIILSPLFNGATNKNVKASPENDSLEGAESAIGYLTAIGETNRANYLKAFIQGIRQINEERPYYWQGVEGISDAWKNSSKMGDDPYVGTTSEDGITISCLEAVDLKLTALFTLYRMAVYDSKYRRYVLPQNLLYFDVDVKIAEIRNFKKTINHLAVVSGGRAGSNDNVSIIGDNTSFVNFKFKDCQWRAEECGKVFEIVGNGDAAVAATSIKWSYGNVLLDGEFSGYDSAILESRNQTVENSDKLLDFVKETAQQMGEQIAEQALSAAANAAKKAVLSRAQSLLFGNVNGAQNAISNALQNPGGAIVGAVTGSGGNGSGGNTDIRLNTTVFDETLQKSNSLPTDNVFNGKPSGPASLNPTNVHE